LTESGVLFFASNKEDDDAPQSNSAEFTQILQSGSASHYLAFSTASTAAAASAVAAADATPAMPLSPVDPVRVASGGKAGAEDSGSAPSAAPPTPAPTSASTAASSYSALVSAATSSLDVSSGGSKRYKNPPPTLLKVAGHPTLADSEKEVRVCVHGYFLRRPQIQTFNRRFVCTDDLGRRAWRWRTRALTLRARSTRCASTRGSARPTPRERRS
jgi:hypothetical protein